MTPFAVERHTREWVTAGLISPAQARSLEEFEAMHHRAEAVPAPTRLGPVAEAGAFIGTVLALIGGGIGLGPQWGEMSLVLRLAVAAAIAVVGLVGGRWLTDMDEPGAQRLGGFLWVLAAGGVALAGGTIMNEIRPDSPWMAIAIGLPVAVLGGALWRNLERPLQLVTFAGGLSATVGGILALGDVTPWQAGAPVWATGAAWWIATRRVTIRPLVIARALGAIAMVGGAFMFADVAVTLGASLALATAAMVVVLALREQHTLVLVVGLIGALEAVQALVQSTFHGPVGGAFVALTGLAMVVVIVLHARRRTAA